MDVGTFFSSHYFCKMHCAIPVQVLMSKSLIQISNDSFEILDSVESHHSEMEMFTVLLFICIISKDKILIVDYIAYLRLYTLDGNVKK